MKGKIKINEKYCKGCGFCVEVCPKGALEQNAKTNEKGYIVPEIINEDECIFCKNCEFICPEMAISIIKGEEEDNNE